MSAFMLFTVRCSSTSNRVQLRIDPMLGNAQQKGKHPSYPKAFHYFFQLILKLITLVCGFNPSEKQFHCLGQLRKISLTFTSFSLHVPAPGASEKL